MPLPPRISRAPGDGLAHPRGGERLGERGVLVLLLAGVLQLRGAKAHRDGGGDVADALHEQVLDELVRGDRLAELHALLGVGAGRPRRRRSRCRSPARRPRSASAAARGRCRGTSRMPGQPHRLGHLDVGQRDVGVLHDAERDLALDLRGREARGSVSTRKPLTCPSASSCAQMTTMSAKVALPIQRLAPLRIQVSPSRRGGRAQAAGRVGAGERLGEAEGADHLGGRHLRQPLRALLGRCRRRRSRPSRGRSARRRRSRRTRRRGPSRAPSSRGTRRCSRSGAPRG